METSFDLGDYVKIVGEFYSNDIYTDPATVEITITSPTGIVYYYIYGVGTDIKKEGIGIYYIELEGTESGLWYYYWKATGNVKGTEPGKFFIRYLA
jgi:hypothetical protein